MESTQQKYGQEAFAQATASVIAARGNELEDDGETYADGAFETPADYLEHLGVDIDVFNEEMPLFAAEVIGSPEEFFPHIHAISAAMAMGIMLGLELAAQGEVDG